MNSKTDYAFYMSQYIDADDAKNIHIFEGHYNRENNTFQRTEKYSCCGKCRPISQGARFDKVATGDTDAEIRKEARRIAKEYEDHGITVCGQCVAKFYSDDI